jgi:hypothetical protein
MVDGVSDTPSVFLLHQSPAPEQYASENPETTVKPSYSGCFYRLLLVILRFCL